MVIPDVGDAVDELTEHLPDGAFGIRDGLPGGDRFSGLLAR